MDKKALQNISYGMFIVSSNKIDAFNAQIANTVFQITNDPVVIAVSINKKNLTHEFITSSLQFGVSILSEETPLNFIGNFGFKSGRDTNKFKDINFKILSSGCPVVLDNAISYRSEEHTSELQSHSFISYAVFCLKKKNISSLFFFFIYSPP